MLPIELAEVVAPDDDYLVTDEDLASVKKCAEKAFSLLEGIAPKLQRIDGYVNDEQDPPHMPPGATKEYEMLAERAQTNLLRPALNGPAQTLYTENHRLSGEAKSSPAWKIWQDNRMDSKQSDIYREALSLGETFVAAEKTNNKKRPVKARMMSRLRTVALYLDPVNDDRAAFVLNVRRMPNDKNTGYGKAWDNTHTYEVRISKKGGKTEITLGAAVPHRFSDTPVISYAPYRSLLGKARSWIETLIPIQDRVNQTIFEMLVAQSYTAFQVKYVTGMVPPPKQIWADQTLQDLLDAGKVESDDPRFEGKDPTYVVGKMLVDVLDEEGNPIPELPEFSPGRLFTLEDPQAKVGTIEGANLTYYIAAAEMAVHHMTIAAQVSPAALAGSIANMSADAITALESTFTRMITELQHKFGESHEQLMQLFAEGAGEEGADDYQSEVTWRDMTSRSLAQVVDAWGKAATMLGVPAKALWERLPGVTGGDVLAWLEQEQDASVNFQAADQQSNRLRSISPENQDLRGEMALSGG